MKLLQVNASYKPAYIYGGPTMSVSKLSEELVLAGAEVEVFTTTANGPGELDVGAGQPINIDGVTVTYFKRVTKDHSHFSPALLKHLWRSVKSFDVVHIHAWWNLVSVLSCWIAIRRGVPVVVSPRGTLSAYSFTNKNNLPKSLMHSLIGKRLLKKIGIHVTSDHEKQAIELLVKPRKIFNIPNFIRLPGCMPLQPVHDEGILRLIFFSRIEEKKGLEILFNALTRVNVSYKLTIAGEGEPAYVKKLKLLAEKAGIAKNVIWAGFLQDDKFEILQQHDLMVLPSFDENFGNAVIESLGVGTAVLISKHVGLSNYVETNRLGWVCEHNPDSFGRQINAIARDRDQLARIRQDGPLGVVKDFSNARLRKEYYEMYLEIITNDGL
ncbi:XrtY-associated glycosyltransferase XYAG1 [Mucilaginibacter ginsenosidivorans]|uniref:Glycosyltransferase n=1 Tax=Mucilaginibacter ginsenosidivorans TaxID=398053 RepID=A0A5B8UVW3_9SPHI|nr:glycosyltransferase [Mucilaginibacter ginsenosidivorans]QEC62576.1 glycosyltransferase [Mucilaginibacter ginsenosidivorans]